TRLGVPDQSPGCLVALAGTASAAQLEADLRQLGGLARPGLTGHDHDLVVADGSGDVVAALRDGELLGVGDGQGRFSFDWARCASGGLAHSISPGRRAGAPTRLRRPDGPSPGGAPDGAPTYVDRRPTARLR